MRSILSEDLTNEEKYFARQTFEPLHTLAMPLSDSPSGSAEVAQWDLQIISCFFAFLILYARLLNSRISIRNILYLRSYGSTCNRITFWRLPLRPALADLRSRVDAFLPQISNPLSSINLLVILFDLAHRCASTVKAANLSAIADGSVPQGTIKVLLLKLYWHPLQYYSPSFAHILTRDWRQSSKWLRIRRNMGLAARNQASKGSRRVWPTLHIWAQNSAKNWCWRLGYHSG